LTWTPKKSTAALSMPAIPAPPLSSYGNMDRDTQAWLTARLTPHPVGTCQEKLMLNKPLGNGCPRV
jgi:hypothetical protein